MGIVIIYGMALLIWSNHRIIDGDEGYYASAARLVAEGKMPYLDFFYPQSPMLPFVYGAWSILTGHSLISFRILSALLTAVTAALWAWYLLKEYCGSVWIALTTLLVLLLNPFFASWGVTVKTYALGNFLVTVTLISIWRGEITVDKRWWVAGGVASGLLVSSRLLYAAVPLAIICWMLLSHDSVANHRLRKPGWFALGLVVASVPAILLFLQNPDGFVFNNVGYHLQRSEGLPLTVRASSDMAFLFATFVSHPYMILQFVLAGFGMLSLFGKKTISLGVVSLISMLALVLASLTPIPHYEQYLTSPLTPFFVPLVGLGAQRLWERSRIVVATSCIVALFLSAFELNIETKASSLTRGWDLATYEDVTNYIRVHTTASDTILSLWPGYVFESGRKHLPGLENHFGILAARGLTPEQRQHYHIAGMDMIISAIEHKRPTMVIIGTWVGPFFETLGDEGRQRVGGILSEHYRLTTQIGKVDIYERESPP